MKTLKQILSLLLCLAMVLSFFPAAYAEEEGSIAPVEEDGEPADGAGTISPADPSDDPDTPAGADAPGGPEEREDPSTRPDGLAQDDTEDGAEALPVGDERQASYVRCGENVDWTFYSGSGDLVISGSGPMYNYSQYKSAPWYEYRSEIKTVEIRQGVTSIGAYAFYCCSEMTVVEIPASVTRIGNYAFKFENVSANDSKMEGVYIKDLSAWCKIVFSDEYSNPLVYAHQLYLNGKAVTELIIPEGITSIGNYAFEGFRGMTSLTIPESVTSIGINVFWSCSGLTSITIPESVTSIGERAFSVCTGLTSVTIPESVTSIQNHTFGGCSGLTSVTIPESVTSIGNGAFSNCSSLASVEIPGSVASIGEYAFRGCSALASVTILGSVTSIGYNAFYSCSGLKAVYIQDIAAWCAIEFSNNEANPLYFAQHLYLNGELVTDLVIPEGVTSIGEYAFCLCIGLTSVSIPASMTTIEYHAFYLCVSLSSVEFMKGVTNFGTDVFYGCDRLKAVCIHDVAAWCATGFSKISDNPLYRAHQLYLNGEAVTDLVIPEGVTSIGKYVFTSCDTLTSVRIPASVTSIGDGAFSDCSSLTDIYIMNTRETAMSLLASVDSEGLRIHYLDGEIVKIAGGRCGDDLYWVLDDTDTLTICGSGAMTDFGSSSEVPWYNSYSGTIRTVAIEPGASRIGNNAFYGCSSLTSVTIPESVTSIGYAFCGCSSLTSVTIPESVTRIEYDAFSNCSGLKAVHIQDIAAWCAIEFSNKEANPLFFAHELYLNGELVTDLVIPEGVTGIGSNAFYYCNSLTSVTIPEGVTSIGSSAFSFCDGLTSVTIPESVTSIGEDAFRLKKSLSDGSNLKRVYIKDLSAWCRIQFERGGWTMDGGTGEAWYDYGSNPLNYGDLYVDGELVCELVIPENVTSISGGAFYNYDSLTSVTIPESVTSIGEHAFYGCDGLTSVEIPGTVTSIGEHAFQRCSALTSVEIPEGMTSIGNSAFCGCTALTSVEIPSTVTSIERYMFHACSALTFVTIHTGVTSIGNSAFYDCSNLRSVVIPDTLTEIQHRSFFNCPELRCVIYSGSETERGGISIGDYNDDLLNATWYYNASIVPSEIVAKENGTASGFVLRGEKLDTLQICPDPGYRVDTVRVNGIVVDMETYTVGQEETLLIEVSFAPMYPERTIRERGYFGDGLTWVLYTDGLLHIGGKGSMKEMGWSWDAPWDRMRSSVQEVLIDEGVTNIGGSAFSYCRSLTRVTIPASVTSIGNNSFSGCSALESVTIPEGVTSIGDSAFANCGKLETILVKEGNPAYQVQDGILYDKAMTTVVCCPASRSGDLIIPDGVTIIGGGAFSGCGGLNNVVLPDGVTSIENAAFYDCSNLRSLVIPGTLTEIMYSAFSGCSELRCVAYSGSETERDGISIEDSNDDLINATWYYNASLVPCEIVAKGNGTAAGFALRGEKLDTLQICPDPGYLVDTVRVNGIVVDMETYTVGQEETLLIEVSFAPMYPERTIRKAGHFGEGLTWVLYTDGLLYISGRGAMKGMGWSWDAPWDSMRSSVQEVLIDEGVTNIGGYAFSNCRSLTRVTIPESVTSIGNNSFSGCSALESVTIPEGVTSIGDSAFANCGKLETILVKEGNPAYQVLDGILYDKAMTTVVCCPASRSGDLIIPDGVTIIGGGAFSGCGGLNNVVLPDGVTSIGGYAFYSCSTLRSVTIPDSVTSIGYSAFWNCYALMSVTIPEGVTTIGSFTFSNCRSLSSVKIPSSMSKIDAYAFSSDYTLRKIVFSGSAPKINENAFSGVKAFTFYSDAETSWTENTRQNYGGTLTWIACSGEINGYVISYNANGGSGAPNMQAAASGETLTITEEIPTRENCEFLGWAEAPDAQEADFLPGETIETDHDMELYAVWTMKQSSGTCGENLTWTLEEQGSLTISGAGTMTDWTNASAVPWFPCRGKIQTVTIRPGVKSVGSYAFSGCGNLTAVTIPAGVTRIGSLAFNDCISLTEIRFKGSAPSIREDAFSGVNATAYYPVSDPSWTEEVRQNYGGNITWVPYLPGDVNGDGLVDILDLVRLRKYLAQVAVEINSVNADLTGDGLVNADDLVRLRKYLVGDPTAVLD